MPKLRVERRVLVLLTEAQMRTLIAYKPKSLGQWRVHLAVFRTGRCPLLDAARSSCS
jgi:hypothetical protein